MFVARFTQSPLNDIERGWSGYFFPFVTDVREAIETAGGSDALDEDLMEEKQSKWIHTYGERYEDWDVFEAEYLEDVADDLNLRQDPHTGAWRPFHHNGLSCWALDADNIDDAIVEAAQRNIQWAGFGQVALGNIQCVAKIVNTGNQEKDEFLYIFECDEIQVEV